MRMLPIYVVLDAETRKSEHAAIYLAILDIKCQSLCCGWKSDHYIGIAHACSFRIGPGCM